MTKNPFLNALVAAAYIALIALLITFGERFFGPVNQVVGPIAFISLFTLSAAVMGYFFLYQPFVLYFEGKKKQAVNLFLQTVAVFGAITLLIFVLLFLKIFPPYAKPRS